MDQEQIQITDAAEWFFFSGGPGAPRYGDDPTKHAVDHDTEAFVREVLQNANDQGLPNDNPVEVTFRFVTLTGAEKEEFLDGLGWDNGLGKRIRAVGDTHNGHRYERVVERVDDPDAELRLLVVEDRNTTGLTGSWDEDSNYAALVRDELYSSKQDDTAGGSYGLGKSVLWTFSSASTVVFNSHLAHGENEGDSPRLVARSKFPTHQLPEDETTYQGAGWLCEPIETEDGPRPESFWGEQASRLAEQLHVDRPAVSGTSAMVVEFQDPTRDERPDLEDLAQEFVDASVKYFWPAIYRGDLDITVETPDDTLTADVENVPAIRPFVEAYDQRTTDTQTLVDPGDVAGLDIPFKLPPRADGAETPDGSVRLSTRLSSPADDDTYLNNVALFRGAGMVVKYYDQSRVAYGDRNFFGVLAAGEARPEGKPSESDREIDRFLRFAEPPEHDEWESTENLREQYQRGFRMALDDVFGTLRDGLRHLISKGNNDDSLSDNVLNRFPIHGSGSPRSTASPAEPVFEIDSSSHFDGDAWAISGRIEVLSEEFGVWSSDISLTGVGEDGSRYEEIPLDHVEVEQSGVSVSFEEGRAHLVANGDVDEVSFSGRTHPDEAADLVHGDVGETQLEILAELRTPEEGDQE
ncbi:hypothetical protein Halru_3022 [Halovivax ruber XH-70]|uniref:Histidine kinase n=1 Tax=Halovivax ruber (strain DSM 18193 / JCM 13892 / XH-70) TaxID=797302 RepID=L0IFG7_HALRX|nr:hypothetical protein [Halovivax ruber]AGB17588.1 hypothetical protein Halru_3022 [Halovivax ruber XH-70]